jgi:hypothetical protein
MGGVENGSPSYEKVSENFQSELNDLKLNIKKESFKAEQELKDEIKRL